jgi:hypothetical protein
LYICNSSKYQYTRKNYKESNDCTVVAFAESFNTTYEKAHFFLKHHIGRKNGRGLYLEEIQKIKTVCQKTKIRFGPYTEQNRTTLKKFCINHPVGRYFVVVRGHALAVINGVVYDGEDTPRLNRQVQFAMRIHVQEE